MIAGWRPPDAAEGFPIMSIRFQRRAARVALGLALVAGLLAGCARTQIFDSPAPQPAPVSAPAAAASGAVIDKPPSCAREGDACGPQTACCGGLVCIGTRTSFCVSRS